MPSSAKHVLLLCLKFTLQAFFQISLFTVTPIILMNMLHRHTVWRLLSMVPSLQVPADDDFTCDTAAVLGATIKETHVITTTTDWKQFVLTMLSFILNPVHFPGIILVFEFSLGTPETSLCFMSVTLSLSAESAAAANSVRADFGVFRWRVITLRFYTEIFFMIIHCHNEVNVYSICSVGLYHMFV
jgi:hypothetical protein